MGAENTKYYHSDLPSFYAVVKGGDILEFPRGNYSHFGVYVGRYKGIRHCVVHLTVSYEPMQGSFLLGLSASLHNLPSQDNSYFISKKIAGANAGNIKINSVEEIMEEGGCVVINNNNDNKWKPLEPTEVVDRAQDYYEHKDDQQNYNLLFNNCEHRANDLRYGQHASPQVEKTVGYGIAGLAAIGVVGVVGAVGAILYSLDRNSEEPRRR